MKPTVIMMAAIAVPVAPAPAPADLLYPAALLFETGYATGLPAGFPWSWRPEYGTPLAMRGRVAAVSAPFTGLAPPGSELTWEFAPGGCVEYGEWDDFVCAGGSYGAFAGGFFAVYLDGTPDADFTDAATLRDGDAVLIAEIQLLYVTDNDPHEVCPMRPDERDWIAYTAFIGGAWFPLVSDAGTGFQGIAEGEIEPDVPPLLAALGYIFPADGAVDIFGPVAVEPTTWGRVKALYR